jgi:hypothetical protein
VQGKKKVRVGVPVSEQAYKGFSSILSANKGLKIFDT